MKVLALTRYGDQGGSSRVRVLQYLPLLAATGIEIAVQPLFSNADLAALYADGNRPSGRLLTAFIHRFAAIIRAADVVWMQQEIFPFLPFAVEAGLLSGRRVVLDFDDANQLYYQMHPRPFVRRFFGAKIDRLMAYADAVVVGSPVMAEHARAAGAKQVHIVPSAVDTARFTAAAEQRPANFTVGWIGTPMTAAQSLHILAAPLAQFLGETGASCLLMGAQPDQFPALKAQCIPWREADEPGFMERISVGLCPLENGPWTRGKSGYKIIQYMAAGRAVLTSPVAIAGELVADGSTGVHCTSADDWYNALTRLHDNAVLCKDMGARGREIAQARYDIHLAADQLRDILQTARG